MLLDWLSQLIDQGVEKLRSLILGLADKRWFITLVLILAVVGIVVMLATRFSFDIMGVLKFVAAIAVAIFIISKIEKR